MKQIAVVDIIDLRVELFDTAHEAAIHLLGRDTREYGVYINVPIPNPEFNHIEKTIQAALEKI
jgi:hypothetical protein